MRVGAAATKSSRSSTAGWAGLGERDGTVYERNRCCKASSNRGQLQSGGYGLVSGVYRTPCVGWGNFRVGSTGLAREATVKVYGVAVARPQGQSRAPRPLIETQ